LICRIIDLESGKPLEDQPHDNFPLPNLGGTLDVAGGQVNIVWVGPPTMDAANSILFLPVVVTRKNDPAYLDQARDLLGRTRVQP
jgi:hypothetical protein